MALHHFHDTLGGTCIRSAYEQVEYQLGQACAAADEILHLSLRRRMRLLEDDPLQRIILFNGSDQPYDGYTEFEPWLEWERWSPAWRLLDEAGSLVPVQTLAPEAQLSPMARILFRVTVDAGQLRTLRIDRQGGNAAHPLLAATSGGMSSDLAAVDLDAGSLGFEQERQCPLPHLEIINDLTDTWSHDVDRFQGGRARDHGSVAPLNRHRHRTPDGVYRSDGSHRAK